MKRYYYIDDDLSDIALLERDLEQGGVSSLQVHVVSDKEGSAQVLGLKPVASLFRRDFVRSLVKGAVIGGTLAVALFIGGQLLGVEGETATTMLAIGCLFVFGAFTWEGGLWGIESPNRQFKKFGRALSQGKHVVFVDIEAGQAKILRQCVKRRVKMQSAGESEGESDWFFRLRKHLLA